MHSSHTFIFPFEWKLNRAGQPLIEDQNNLANCAQSMTSDGWWSRMTNYEKPATKARYNETVYFYDFVRPALFDSGASDALLHHYAMDIPTETNFSIQKGEFHAKLRVVSVEIRLYSMGVGVLSLQMNNDEPGQADPETILKINQYGRRLFPPFYNITHPDASEEAYYTEASWPEGLNDHPELPDSLSLLQVQGDKDKILWKEDFQAYRQAPELNQAPGLLQFLLPPTFLETVCITPVLDDRMFVLCWYANDGMAEKAKTVDTKDDWWYRYLFVDISRTVQHEKTMATLLQQHTHPRWADWGTLFGVARYSFVCLTTEGAPAFLLAHVRTLYTRMVELALVQRACVLRFSEEVTAISTLSPQDRHLPARMESLFRQHLRFVNKVYFREITAQEQGIELYDLLRKSMRLDEQVTALEKEIAELHSYAASIAEGERNEKLDMLTYIGAYLAVPGFIASYYGGINYKMNEGIHWIVMIALFGIYAFLVWLMMRTRGQKRLWLGLVVVAMVFFALFGVPHFFK